MDTKNICTQNDGKVLNLLVCLRVFASAKLATESVTLKLISVYFLVLTREWIAMLLQNVIGF